MESDRKAQDEWLQFKLAELDSVERKIEAARPHNDLRERLLLLFLLVIAIGTGVVVSVEPSLLAWSLFASALFISLTTFVAIVAPRHRLKALLWQRDELLGQLGTPSSHDAG